MYLAYIYICGLINMCVDFYIKQHSDLTSTYTLFYMSFLGVKHVKDLIFRFIVFTLPNQRNVCLSDPLLISDVRQSPPLSHIIELDPILLRKWGNGLCKSLHSSAQNSVRNMINTSNPCYNQELIL